MNVLMSAFILCVQIVFNKWFSFGSNKEHVPLRARQPSLFDENIKEMACLFVWSEVQNRPDSSCNTPVKEHEDSQCQRGLIVIDTLSHELTSVLMDVEGGEARCLYKPAPLTHSSGPLAPHLSDEGPS